MATDPTVTTEARDRFHTLKAWPEFFDAVEAGAKTFEVRRADRDYQVGDVLLLQRWEPDREAYTLSPDGHPLMCARRVTYILRGGQWGIEPKFVVMGIASVRHD